MPIMMVWVALLYNRLSLPNDFIVVTRSSSMVYEWKPFVENINFEENYLTFHCQYVAMY